MTLSSMIAEMWWHRHWWAILMCILCMPVFASVVFAGWLRRQEAMNLETGSKCWDTFTKVVGAFTVIFSGAMVFGKYIEQQEVLHAAQLQQGMREINLQQAAFLRQKLEFDSARHERKRALFEETKVLVAHLAKTAEPDAKSIDRFDQLYLGALIGVELPNGPVEAAMVRFERKLRKASSAPSEDLYSLSLQLSKACEQELKESEDALLAQHAAIVSLVNSQPNNDRPAK